MTDKTVQITGAGIDTQHGAMRTVDVMKRLFRAPNPILMIVPIIVVSIFYGLLIGFEKFTWFESVWYYGFILLAFPTLLSSVFTKVLAELLGGILYWRRSMLLAFVSLLISGFVLVLLKLIVVSLYGVRISVVVIFSFSLVIWIRHLILVVTSNSSTLRSLPASIVFFVLGIAGYYLITPFFVVDSVFLVMFPVIFLGSIGLFMRMINAPFRRNFNWNGIGLLSHSLAQMTEGKDSGVEKLEDFFASFSEAMQVPIQVVGFKTKKGFKMLMVVPYVHPGPFGRIGGSDLPVKLAQQLLDIADHVIVPHSATNHDYNLAVSQDVKYIVSAVKRCVKRMKFTGEGSAFVRCHNGFDICAQQLGNALLLIHTSAPEPTDDIDAAIGQLVSTRVQDQIGGTPIFIDAHNCLERGSGCVFFNTEKAQQILTLSEVAAKKTVQHHVKKLSMGYAQRTSFSIDENALGPQGIQVVMIKAMDHNYGYVFFDGNNMVKGLREQILEAIKDRVADAEVFTTDNHVVNIQIGGYNPIGMKSDASLFITAVRELVDECMDNMEEVMIGVEQEMVSKVRLFGSGNTARISATINAIVSSLKLNSTIMFLIAILLSILGYLVIEL